MHEVHESSSSRLLPLMDEMHGGVEQASHLLAPANDATADSKPRGSTETIRSLDISHNIPRIIFPMDAEDSPWGGRPMSFLRRFQC